MTDGTSNAGRDEARSVLLEAKAVSKSYAGIRVLDNVDLNLTAGSVHAVVGHNGAGKSTLMKVFSGLHRSDSGQILVDGRVVQFASPHDAQRHQIATVYQELSVLPDLDVAENILLGREPRARSGLVDSRELYERAERIITDLDVDLRPRVPCSSLSVGERQMVEIARAVSQEARILILDEPTGPLGVQEQQRLFALIDRLQASGIAILYVSHHLDEVLALADTVTVLKDGLLVITRAVAGLQHDTLVELMIGKRQQVMGAPTPPHSEQVLEVESLSSTAMKLHDISFSVRRGEIVGLCGMLGSGRSEILQCIFGAADFDTGSIRVSGRALRASSPREAMARGVVLAPEDFREQAIFSSLPLWTNVALGSLHDLLGSMGFVKRGAALRAAEDLIRRLGIVTRSPFQNAGHLSGGNQQKVVLARWLVRQPQVLLLDDPTVGVDVGAIEDILQLVRLLADEGAAVVVVSSEFEELLALCHRILAVRDGAIVAEVDPQESDEGYLVYLATGGVPTGTAEDGAT